MPADLRMMGLRRKALRGSITLTVGEGVVYVCSFVKNMILARLLTKADFGIVATFSLIVTLLEMSDKLGMARFVVRDKDGDNPKFIAAAHLVHAAVATLSAVAIAAFAAPLSVLFGIPGQRWAIVCLALVPLCRGFEHLDLRRFERRLRFAPSLSVEAVPQIITAVAAWPMAVWLGDYRAVLVLLIAKGAIACVGSHLLAEEPYRWRIDRVYIARMLRFGWPLAVTGFLMFGVLQGEQFVIAAGYTMAELAPYAAAAALSQAPTFFFTRVFNSLTLPILADVQDDPSALASRYRSVLGIAAVFAVIYGASLILAGESLMRIAYGTKYAGAGILLGWLAAAQAFRTLRIPPGLAAIAKGDSQNQMIQNGWRLIALMPAAVLASARQPFWSIACTGLAGEALACWMSFLRLKRRDAVPLSSSLVPASCVLIAVAGAGFAVFFGLHRLPPTLGVLAGVLGAASAGATTLLSIAELREEAASLYAHWRHAGWRGWLTHLDRADAPRTISVTQP